MSACLPCRSDVALPGFGLSSGTLAGLGLVCNYESYLDEARVTITETFEFRDRATRREQSKTDTVRIVLQRPERVADH